MVSEESAWNVLPTAPPAHPNGAPPLAIFKPLESIHTSIVGAAISRGVLEENKILIGPLVVNTGWESELERCEKSTPDGYLYLKNMTFGENDCKVLDYADIVLFMELEYGSDAVDLENNTAKLLWNMRHKMAIDPRCRHIAGLTVEGTQMRFWHCDRSGVAVSHPFDFLKEPDYLIYIFLALAGSNEIELGLDPTIRLVNATPTHSEVPSDTTPLPSGNRTYQITVREENGDERVFETLAVISDASAWAVCSHGTRVWKVFEVLDPLKTPRVLKDSWIDSNSPSEAEIINDIHVRLGDKPEKLCHFPTLHTHGAVCFPRNPIDDTLGLIQRRVDWSDAIRLALIPVLGKLLFYTTSLPVDE
ncbi:12217_t:CDS:2, partial [Acaulospora colombiana]